MDISSNQGIDLYMRWFLKHDSLPQKLSTCLVIHLCEELITWGALANYILTA